MIWMEQENKKRTNAYTHKENKRHLVNVVQNKLQGHSDMMEARSQTKERDHRIERHESLTDVTFL